jgi:serine/threonine protein phosphatase PrpC
MKGRLKSYLSCIPDVVSFDIDPSKDDFILLSTDGIFQSMPIAEVTDLISEKYNKLEAEESPNKILSSIIENCKIISPDSDNMAVILIIIRKGQVGAAKAW